MAYFVSRVNQGVSTLGWTQAKAFNYFKNSVKSTTANWLDSHTTFLHDEALEWEIVKPHFREAFGDTSDPMVIANTMFGIKLSSFNNNLYNYTNTITKVLKLHTETFLTNHPSLVNSHRLNAAQLLQRTKDLNTHGHAIHDQFQKFQEQPHTRQMFYKN